MNLNFSYSALLMALILSSSAVIAESSLSGSEESKPVGSSKKANLPAACQTNCVHEYGLQLGSSPAGIPAYSNCNSACVIFEPNHLQDIYTGIKWQCVEYARRWWLHEFAVVFGDVDIAADIWDLQFVVNPLTDEKFALQSLVNGSSSMPQRGDLLIYAEQYLQTGHVAVIVNVDEETQVLQLAEQNYSNTKWDEKFAREISYRKVKNHYWLLDAYLIGIKRVKHKLIIDAGNQE